MLDTIVPFFCVKAVPFTPWDWNYTTTPQVGLNDRSVVYPRGHILGGSSSVSESISIQLLYVYDFKLAQISWPIYVARHKTGTVMPPLLEITDGVGTPFNPIFAGFVVSSVRIHS